MCFRESRRSWIVRPAQIGFFQQGRIISICTLGLHACLSVLVSVPSVVSTDSSFALRAVQKANYSRQATRLPSDKEGLDDATLVSVLSEEERSELRRRLGPRYPTVLFPRGKLLSHLGELRFGKLSAHVAAWEESASRVAAREAIFDYLVGYHWIGARAAERRLAGVPLRVLLTTSVLPDGWGDLFSCLHAAASIRRAFVDKVSLRVVLHTDADDLPEFDPQEFGLNLSDILVLPHSCAGEGRRGAAGVCRIGEWNARTRVARATASGDSLDSLQQEVSLLSDCQQITRAFEAWRQFAPHVTIVMPALGLQQAAASAVLFGHIARTPALGFLEYFRLEEESPSKPRAASDDPDGVDRVSLGIGPAYVGIHWPVPMNSVSAHVAGPAQGDAFFQAIRGLHSQLRFAYLKSEPIRLAWIVITVLDDILEQGWTIGRPLYFATHGSTPGFIARLKRIILRSAECALGLGAALRANQASLTIDDIDIQAINRTTITSLHMASQSFPVGRSDGHVSHHALQIFLLDVFDGRSVPHKGVANLLDQSISPTGCTGDLSLSEVLARGKVPFYDGRRHKRHAIPALAELARDCGAPRLTRYLDGHAALLQCIQDRRRLAITPLWKTCEAKVPERGRSDEELLARFLAGWRLHVGPISEVEKELREIVNPVLATHYDVSSFLRRAVLSRAVAGIIGNSAWQQVLLKARAAYAAGVMGISNIESELEASIFRAPPHDYDTQGGPGPPLCGFTLSLPPLDVADHAVVWRQLPGAVLPSDLESLLKDAYIQPSNVTLENLMTALRAVDPQVTHLGATLVARLPLPESLEAARIALLQVRREVTMVSYTATTKAGVFTLLKSLFQRRALNPLAAPHLTASVDSLLEAGASVEGATAARLFLNGTDWWLLDELGLGVYGTDPPGRNIPELIGSKLYGLLLSDRGRKRLALMQPTLIAEGQPTVTLEFRVPALPPRSGKRINQPRLPPMDVSSTILVEGTEL